MANTTTWTDPDGLHQNPGQMTPNAVYVIDPVTLKAVSPATSTGDASDLSTTGTISAAQANINTPVASATVVLATGSGQSSWKAQLVNGGGGFTSGTTIVADGSVDGGTTWYAKSFKVSGSSPNTGVSSVVGPGPLEITGNAAGLTHVRIRCSVLNATETIAVTLRASVGVSDVGLISSIPAGSNVIGGITAAAAAFADGAIMTLGLEADSAVTNPAISATAIAILKGLLTNTADLLADGDNLATIATNTTGVATAANQTTGNTSLSTIATNTGNIPAKGQATMANSIPVVQASDSAARTWTRIYNTTQTGVSSWAGSGNLTSLDQYTYLIVNINVSALTGTSIQFKINRIDGFNNVNTLANGSTISSASTTDKFSVGPGCSQNHPFGQTASVTAALTAISSVTFTVEVWAR